MAVNGPNLVDLLPLLFVLMVMTAFLAVLILSKGETPVWMTSIKDALYRLVFGEKEVEK